VVRELRGTATCARTGKDPVTGAPVYSRRSVTRPTSAAHEGHLSFGSLVTSDTAPFAPGRRQIGSSQPAGRASLLGERTSGSFSLAGPKRPPRPRHRRRDRPIGTDPIFTYYVDDATGAPLALTPPAPAAADLPTSD